ncbi:MAG: adenylate/guanylate cyclase domain-containing protein, partial [Chromatocurvus sp.]
MGTMASSTNLQCAQCGAEMPIGARFCAQCGAAVAPREDTAELRELTVLFCDLVGSTELADTLDPEDYRDLTSAYHSVASRAIERQKGHIAQYLGDGILVYFGYPNAHEDDARRAVDAGLGILHGIETLNHDKHIMPAVELAVRVGIHTGPVVVGEVGAGQHRENLALGRTPNVAARIQSSAQAGTVLISGDTARAVRGYFEYETLGERQLKGLSEPVTLHRVLRGSGVRSRLDASRRLGLTAFTGRSTETAQLFATWHRVADTAAGSHTLLLRGEPGIG